MTDKVLFLPQAFLLVHGRCGKLLKKTRTLICLLTRLMRLIYFFILKCNCGLCACDSSYFFFFFIIFVFSIF